MAVEKPQVTFAPGGVRRLGPHAEELIAVYWGLFDCTQHLVVYGNSKGQMEVSKALAAPMGALKGHTYSMWCAEISNVAGEVLEKMVGLQEELDFTP